MEIGLTRNTIDITSQFLVWRNYEMNQEEACYRFPSGKTYNYQWSPQCPKPLLQFSARSWCEFPPHLRNILLIGDSDSQTADHTGFAIMNEIMREMHMNRSYCTTFGKEGGSFSTTCPDGKPLKITGIRNDRLTLTQSFHEDIEHNFVEYPFLSSIGALNVSLLIMNRGSHYVKDDLLLSQLKETLTTIYNKYPNISIIYRNTPYGNLLIEELFLSPPLTKKQVNDNIPTEWNHVNFEHQNTIASKLLDEFFPQVLQLDVFTSTVLRGDSHRDPLHYCVGTSAMTNWVKLIYNIVALMAHKTHLISNIER